MPPIEIGPARSVGPVQVRTRPAAATATQQPGASSPVAASSPFVADASPVGTSSAITSPAVERSAAFDPGAAPVDAERVAVIRRAVEQGNYPVIPTKIADAMIAAGMLLRSPQP